MAFDVPKHFAFSENVGASYLSGKTLIGVSFDGISLLVAGTMSFMDGSLFAPDIKGEAAERLTPLVRAFYYNPSHKYQTLASPDQQRKRWHT